MAGNIFSSINMKILPMKAHYFLFHLGSGPVFANISMIARQKGFSSTVVGALLTAFCLIGTASRPFFGWFADRFKMHKFVFITMQMITALCFFSVYFIPSTSSQVKVNNITNSIEMYFCPRNPVWDKCLEKRIQEHETKILKCQLYCKSVFWLKEKNCMNVSSNDCSSNYEPFEDEILVDMRTIEKNLNCIILKELQPNKSSITTNNLLYGNLPLQPAFNKTNCEITCEDEFLKGTLANRGAIPDDEISQKYEFWLFCILLLIGNSSKSVVLSMADTICFDLLGDDSHKYGRQRMWDSIGAGIAAVCVGAVIDKISGGSVFKDYTVIYFFCLIAISINIMCSTQLTYNQPKKSKSILKDVGGLLKSVKIITFFCWCIFCGMFSAAIWNFVFWHLEELTDEIGQNECGKNHVKTLEGLDLLIQCLIGEIPFFFWSGHILKKIGHVNCMHLIFGAFAIRFFYYSLLSNPWWVLPIEVFNGITYGLLHSTMTSYTNFIALPGTEATLQGLVGALFEGIGVSFGNLAAGNLFNYFGGHYTFMIFAITAVSVMTIHILLHAFLRSKL